jgi:AAA+ superfamily predicted ATPase
MGHYGNTTPTALYNSAPEAVFHGYKQHSSATRANTDFAIKNVIRDSHPDCHITCVAAREVSLVEYAEAGHGTVTLRKDGDNYLASRDYSPPPTRLVGGDGSLAEKVDFGFYSADYSGFAVEFYKVKWFEPPYRWYSNFYILSPKSSLNSKGHSEEVDKLVLAAGKWTNDLHDEIYVFDAGSWIKNKHLWAAVQNSSWNDVILDPTMKETLISDIENFFDSRSLYEEYAVPWKRGIIFHGTPGCGKTISIKALMNSLQKRDPPVASLYVKSFKACAGDEYSIREIFGKARIMAPCLLVFEDLDSLVKDKVRSYFLNEVDGLEDNNGILMIGSTNHLDRLDPGISKRPSRFDRKWHYKLPGHRERVLYSEYWKKKLEKNSNVDFDPEICEVVAKLTDGFSFAYLKELFIQTLLTIVGGRAHDVEIEEEEDMVVVADKPENSVDVPVTDVEEKEAAEKPKPEIRIPKVEIPESLQSNALMRTLQKQAIALWKDMDNSKDDDTRSGSGKVLSRDDEDDESDNGSDSDDA